MKCPIRRQQKRTNPGLALTEQFVNANPLLKNVAVWERELQGDSDKDYLLDRINNGFYIIDDDMVSTETDNHVSANLKDTKYRVEKRIQ